MLLHTWNHVNYGFYETENNRCPWCWRDQASLNLSIMVTGGKRERASQAVHLPPSPLGAVLYATFLFLLLRFVNYWHKKGSAPSGVGEEKDWDLLVYLYFLYTHPSPSFSKTSNTSSGCLVKLSSSNFFSCLWMKK